MVGTETWLSHCHASKVWWSRRDCGKKEERGSRAGTHYVFYSNLLIFRKSDRDDCRISLLKAFVKTRKEETGGPKQYTRIKKLD